MMNQDQAGDSSEIYIGSPILDGGRVRGCLSKVCPIYLAGSDGGEGLACFLYEDEEEGKLVAIGRKF